MNPHILSVNTGRVQSVTINGRLVTTAIGKTPVTGKVAVHPLGLEGDEQADPTVHGGLAKAVYAYPTEHYPFWQTVRAQAKASMWDEPLPHGAMGENLSLSGLLEADVWVGDVLEFPGCTLRVEQPREPCFKFNAAMGFNTAVKAMAQSGLCGFYLSVHTPGTLQSGDDWVLHPGPRRIGIPERFNARMFKHMR